MSILWTGESSLRLAPQTLGAPSRRRLITGLFTILGLVGLVALGGRVQASCAPSITSVTLPSPLSANSQYSARVYVANAQSGYLIRLNDQNISNGVIVGGSVNLQGNETYVDIPFSTGAKGTGNVYIPFEVWDACYVVNHGSFEETALWAD